MQYIVKFTILAVQQELQLNTKIKTTLFHGGGSWSEHLIIIFPRCSSEMEKTLFFHYSTNWTPWDPVVDPSGSPSPLHTSKITWTYKHRKSCTYGILQRGRVVWHDSVLHPLPWPVLFMHILWCNLDEEATIITITVSSGPKIAELYVVHLYAHNLGGGCISVCKHIK